MPGRRPAPGAGHRLGRTGGPGTILVRLRENGMLDDSRYAKQFTRQRTEIRRQGKFRITRDLRARGVPDSHIEAALAESADPESERAAIRLRIQRKLKLTRGEVTDNKIASLYRSLLRAGFPSDAVRRELQTPDARRATTRGTDRRAGR